MAAFQPASPTTNRVPPETAVLLTSDPFQTELTPHGAVKPSFQPLVAVAPPFFTTTSPWKPVSHFPVTLNTTFTPWLAAGTSSLTIVAMAVALLSVAPCGDESTSENVSSGSTAASPVTATRTSCRVVPAANVTVPLAPVKSLPAIAVPSAVR
jgi:hypothetical protein